MKTLFDRLSDLLSGRNPERRGRALAGREAWLLAVGSDPHLPDGFERPFQMTADYLGMRWREGFYVRSGKAADESTIEKLAAELRAAA
jgi:putative NADPH-quinone reductase